MSAGDRPIGSIFRESRPGRVLTAEASEWIIRRCTQKWIGAELQYENWPAAAFAFGLKGLLTRSQMMRALELCGQRWPNDEFAGHNVANCRCPEHDCLRRFVTS